jgi:hypothetical protein
MIKPFRFLPASRASRLALAAAALGAAGALALPSDAQAYWRGGVWVGVGGGPFYYAPPPVYVPPPVYYAPPPVVYAPPPPPDYTPAPQLAPQNTQATAYGYTCYAGNYTCALPQSGPVGSTCSCPGIGAPSYGSIH